MEPLTKTESYDLIEEDKSSITSGTENDDIQRAIKASIAESNALKEDLNIKIFQNQNNVEKKDLLQQPLEEFKSNIVPETENEDIQKAINDAMNESNKDLLNGPNAIEQVRIKAARKITTKDKITQSKTTFDQKSGDSIFSRTAEAAKKGATTFAAASVGKEVLAASFSTIYGACDLALSKNKKRALARVLPGVALSLIPGIGLVAGIGLSVASGYLGGKAYDKVLSSRTAEVYHTMFLPDTLISDIDDRINLLKVKVMSMGTPYFECRPLIVDLTVKTEEYLDNNIKEKIDEIEAEINSVEIKEMSVDDSVDIIKSLIKKTESWYNSLCDNLQQLEQYIETLLMEEPENLIRIQDEISKAYDDLVEIITKDVPEALKEGMKQMQGLLKIVQE